MDDGNLKEEGLIGDELSFEVAEGQKGLNAVNISRV